MPGSQHQLQRQRPHRFRGLGEAAAEHPQQLEQVLVGDPRSRATDASCAAPPRGRPRCRPLRRAPGSAAPSPGARRPGTRADAAALGHLLGRVALGPPITRSAEQEHRACRLDVVRRSSSSVTPWAASCSQQRQALARARRPPARRAGPPPRSRCPRAIAPASLRQAGVRQPRRITGHDRARHRPRPRQHRLRRRGAPRRPAAGARRGRHRDAPRGSPRSAGWPRSTPPSRRCWRSTARRRWRSSSSTSARTCARPSPSGRPAGW